METPGMTSVEAAKRIASMLESQIKGRTEDIAHMEGELSGFRQTLSFVRTFIPKDE